MIESEILINNINSQMPFHTPKTTKIKLNYSNRMPKNIRDLSDKVYSKFLDNHLGEIEDKKLSWRFKKWFANQSKYHNSDIVSKDSFFTKLKNYIEADMSSNLLACGFLINRYSVLPPVVPCDEGSELTCGSTEIHSAGNNNYFFAGPVSGSTTDLCYDQIAVNCASGTGNWVMGAYEDDSGAPVAKIEQTSQVTTMNTSFDYTDIPEFTSEEAKFWLATVQSNSLGRFYYDTDPADGYYKASAYSSTMPDPAPAPIVATDEINMKVTHS